MKIFKPFFIIAFLFAFCASALSYEIHNIGDIPLNDTIASISVNPVSGTSACISRETKTLYLIDTDTNNVIRKIPLEITPSGVVIDAKRNLAVVSSQEGFLQFVDIDTGTIVKTLTFTDSEKGAACNIQSLALMNANNNLLLACGSSLLVADTEAEQIIRAVFLTDKIISMDIDHTAGLLLLTLEGKSEVFTYNLQSLEPLTSINTGKPASGVAVNQSTHIAVLANSADNSLSVVSLETGQLLDTIQFHSSPKAVSIDSINNTAYIASKDKLTVIKLENPVPRIDRLIPESSNAGNPGFTLSILGSKFIKDSKARFNLKELDTLFEDNGNLKAQVPSEELLIPKDVPVSVTNPAPGGGTSGNLIFKIYNPAPKIESVTPNTAALTKPAVELKVFGRNFLPGSVINFNGSNLKTTFISSILLKTVADLSDIKTPAQYPVTVINPIPVRFTSNVAFLNIVADESQIPDSEEIDGKDENQKTRGILTGRILDTQKKPIEGITIKIKNKTAMTDANGYFILRDVPSGKKHLMVHGSTAKATDKHYPTIPFTVDIEGDKTNSMPFQIYFHQQKNRNFKLIDPLEDTVLTDPEVPGVEMRIPKGVNITGWDGKANLKVSVRTVPTDRLPVKPLPKNAFVKSVYMFYFDKVGGGVPDQPIPFKAPNDLGLLPGEKAVLWYYDESPNEGDAPNDWAIAGTGTVTPDGRYIITDPGVGIPKFCCGASAWGGSNNDDDGGGDDNDCKGGCCSGMGTAGDPVDLSNGYFIHSKTDLHIPGIIPVNIARYYRTGDTGHSSFGRGVYSEYDWWMGQYTDMLLLIKPGNYQYRFAKQSDNTYINSSDPSMRGAVATVSGTGIKTLRMRDGWTYKFDGSGDLIEITDKNGNKLTLERMSDFEGGYLRKITTPEGRTVTFSQTYAWPVFRTDSITDSFGRTVTYSYESVGYSPDPYYYPRLKRVTYPDGSTIEYQYDSLNRMTGIINERGVREVFNEYCPDDPQEPKQKNRICRQTHADSGVFTFNYTLAGGYITETSVTSPNNSVTVTRFNNYKYVTEKTTPDGTTIYEREPGTNQLLSVTDTLGRQTSYTYYPNGLQHTLTDNLGNVTSYEYDPTSGMPTSITDALGHITTMTYDANGNMLTTTNPGGATTTFTYNSSGKPLTVTDAMGNTSTMQYDASGNLITVTDPLGNISQMTYDNLGRLSVMTDAKGKSTYYNYDVMGRITEVVDSLDGTTRYTYGNSGNLLAVTDAKNHTISYEYDVWDRLQKMTDQLGRTETYGYNTSDSLTRVTDRKGQTTTYTYDLMNRMTRADYADGSYTTYTYDAGGRLITINDSISGAIAYTYTGSGCSGGCGNSGDRIASETTPLGSISYAYDAISRRTSMTVTGQPAVNYTYNTNSRLTGISTNHPQLGALNFVMDYDNVGRRTSLLLPNGVTTNYTYDNASRLLTLDHLNPQPLESLSYTYDANGNRINMSRPSVNLSLPQPVANTSYNEANHMLTFTDKNITYDNNGNMTSVTNSCGTTNYTWDARNRLVGINGYKPDCSALSASFGYDALGRRIYKSVTDTVNGTRTTNYLYDGLDIIQEIENSVPSVNFIRTLNIDEPLARIKADGTVRYYQQDALGSVIALTDTTGTVTTRYTYDPFGNVTITGEASDNPFQYTGRENDGTGLYYYRERYYSPELQRFLSEDPQWLKGGINFYSYVANDPMKYSDPFGLETCMTWFSSYGPWEDIGTPWFVDRVKMVMNNLTVSIGTCFWYRYKVQRQARDVTLNELCCGNSVCGGRYCWVVPRGQTREYRNYETLDRTAKTIAYLVTGNSNAKKPGMACCRNPWTGREICGE